MPTLDKVALDIQVVLGTTSMPIHQVLRLGRGAIIELEASEDDEVVILANNFPVAKGAVIVSGNRIAVEVKDMTPKSPRQALTPSKSAAGGLCPALVTGGPICYMGAVFDALPVWRAFHLICGRGGIGRRTSLRC